MSEDPRDDAIGRLLRAMPAAPSGTEQSDCLDAEILALWADNGLSGPARVRAEGHAAGCARCQALLAAMARTAGAAADVAPDASGSRSWVRRLFPWMAPLGVAAAATLMWVAVLPRTAPPPAAPAPPPGLAGNQAASARAAAEKDAPADAAPTSPREREKQSRDEFRAVAEEKPAETSAGSAPPPDADARKVGQAKLADAVTPRAPPPPAPVPPLAPEAPLLSAAAGERQEPSRLARQTAAIQESVHMAPIEIASPDPKIRWRIVDGRLVLQSIDAGATWTTQPIGTEAFLLAGSAPSGSVCWLAGQQGTLLLTTDGRTWQRVTFPERVDLQRIISTGPDAATVTAADGRTFVTTDRGATWTPRR